MGFIWDTLGELRPDGVSMDGTMPRYRRTVPQLGAKAGRPVAASPTDGPATAWCTAFATSRRYVAIRLQNPCPRAKLYPWARPAPNRLPALLQPWTHGNPMGKSESEGLAGRERRPAMPEPRSWCAGCNRTSTPPGWRTGRLARKPCRRCPCWIATYSVRISVAQP